MRKPLLVLLCCVLALWLVGSACKWADQVIPGRRPAITWVVPEISPTERFESDPYPGATATQVEQQSLAPTAAQEALEAEQPAYPEPEATEKPPLVALATDCAQLPCVLPGTFVLDRPVGSNARATADPSNRYGEYQRSIKGANRSIMLLNSTGTPVLAAADGTVVYAGDDLNKSFGPFTDFYGNMVILEHRLPGIPEALYTLYGQLSEVLVKNGEQVQAGDVIGKVGMTGSVSGSTLRFEVRYGENSYAATRNPDLWLRPLVGTDGQLLGAIVGRVLDNQGNPVEVTNIVVERLEGSRTTNPVYLRTYANRRLTGLEPWRENFAIGDLPAGEYKVSFWLQGYQSQVVQVEAGKVTLLGFKLR